MQPKDVRFLFPQAALRFQPEHAGALHAGAKQKGDPQPPSKAHLKEDEVSSRHDAHALYAAIVTFVCFQFGFRFFGLLQRFVIA